MTRLILDKKKTLKYSIVNKRTPFGLYYQEKTLVCMYERGGGFHISHDASLHTILSSFQTHVTLSVQQGRDS